ncbi:hypothetical protein ASE00_07735 [Sphingomonas sp. Root710]|nr:hypothetical protein ASE00_07735 [Sphingomonas sp. Root710]
MFTLNAMFFGAQIIELARARAGTRATESLGPHLDRGIVHVALPLARLANRMPRYGRLWVGLTSPLLVATMKGDSRWCAR